MLEATENGWGFDDPDAGFTKLADAAKNVDADSQARLVGQLRAPGPAALRFMLQGPRVNELVDTGALNTAGRDAITNRTLKLQDAGVDTAGVGRSGSTATIRFRLPILLSPV